jgi:hypothetical protein
MDKQDPSQVLLGEYDLTEKCDCIDQLCAPLTQEVKINSEIILCRNLQQLSLL